MPSMLFSSPRVFFFLMGEFLVLPEWFSEEGRGEGRGDSTQWRPESVRKRGRGRKRRKVLLPFENDITFTSALEEGREESAIFFLPSSLFMREGKGRNGMALLFLLSAFV